MHHKQPTSPSHAIPKQAATGMSTMGMVLALVVLAVIAAGIVYKLRVNAVMDRFADGKYRAGVAQVRSLEMKVKAYVLDVGKTPASLDDLVTAPAVAKGWNGPYAKAWERNDPFGHAFVYKVPGDHGDYDIVFLGKDGQPGGKGIDEDFGNWQSN